MCPWRGHLPPLTLRPLSVISSPDTALPWPCAVLLREFFFVFLLRWVLVVTHGLSNCEAWAQLPAAWGILVPQAGIEPVSPTLEGGFLTTGPPGKTPIKFYNTDFCSFLGRAISSCLRTFACAVLKTWNTFLLLYSPLLTLQAWVRVSLPQGGLPALLFELCTSPGNPIRV